MRTVVVVLVMLALCGIVHSFADTTDILLGIPYVVKTVAYGAIAAFGLWTLLEPPSAFGSTEFGSQLLLGSFLAVGGGLLVIPPAWVLVNLRLGHPKGVTLFRILTAVEDGAILGLTLYATGLGSIMIPLAAAALFVLDLLPFSVESNEASQDPTPTANSGHGSGPDLPLLTVALQDGQQTAAPGSPRGISVGVAFRVRL
jgi:hypothetical protein